MMQMQNKNTPELNECRVSVKLLSVCRASCLKSLWLKDLLLLLQLNFIRAASSEEEEEEEEETAEGIETTQM